MLKSEMKSKQKNTKIWSIKNKELKKNTKFQHFKKRKSVKFIQA